MDRTKEMYNWTEEQTATLACVKLEGVASLWLRAEEKRKALPTQWNDRQDNNVNIVGMRSTLLLRFGRIDTTASAVEAIRDLKQMNNESCSAFYDRVGLAMDLKNHDIADKNNAAYRVSLERDTKAFMLAGLKEEFRQRVLGVPNPPADLDGIMEVLRAAESELTHKKSYLMKMTQESEEEERQVEAIRREAAGGRRQGANKSNLVCYNCQKPGHYKHECMSKSVPRGQPPVYGRAGRANRGRGNTAPTDHNPPNYYPSNAPAGPSRGYNRGRGSNRGTRDQRQVRQVEEGYFDEEASVYEEAQEEHYHEQGNGQGRQ